MSKCKNTYDRTTGRTTICIENRNTSSKTNRDYESKSSSGSSKDYTPNYISEEIKSVLTNINTSPIIAKPKISLEGINMETIEGWYVPTYKEIVNGMNPHFKILTGDTHKCIIAKTKYNQAISDAFNLGNDSGSSLGLIAESVRVKKELDNSFAKLREDCSKKLDKPFGDSNFISSRDFDKYI